MNEMDDINSTSPNVKDTVIDNKRAIVKESPADVSQNITDQFSPLDTIQNKNAPLKIEMDETVIDPADVITVRNPPSGITTLRQLADEKEKLQLEGFPVSNWDHYEFVKFIGEGGMG